jgi:hypothetical protein
MTPAMSDRWQGKDCAWNLAQILLDRPGSVVELRALSVGKPGRTCSGYFDDPGALVDAAESLDGQAAGIYVTLNPVDPKLLARSGNRLTWGPKHTTSDSDVYLQRITRC